MLGTRATSRNRGTINATDSDHGGKYVTDLSPFVETAHETADADVVRNQVRMYQEIRRRLLVAPLLDDRAHDLHVVGRERTTIIESVQQIVEIFGLKKRDKVLARCHVK